MKLTHIIGGEKITRDPFVVNGPFDNYPQEYELTPFTEADLGLVKRRLDNPSVPPMDRRLEIIHALSQYTPSQEVLKQIASMRGVPISVLQQEAEEGRNLVTRISNSIDLSEYQGNGQTATVAIPHNNIGEVLYFIAWLTLSGSPSVIKASSQEPLTAYNIFEHLAEGGNSPSFIDLAYVDTSDPTQSIRFKELMEYAQVPIVMGESGIVDHQMTFDAARSRALILPGTDLTTLEENLLYSITQRDSCLAEKNLIVVGRELYEQVIDLVTSMYQNLTSGNLHEPSTTLGIIPDDIVRDTREILAQGRSFDALSIPGLEGSLTEEQVREGIVFTYNQAGKGIPPHYALWGQMPEAFLTGIYLVESESEAIKLLTATQNAMTSKGLDPKVMALSVYGGTKLALLERLSPYAHDLHNNKTPAREVGVTHQGRVLGRYLINGGP